jgi:hypothetical protein
MVASVAFELITADEDVTSAAVAWPGGILGMTVSGTVVASVILEIQDKADVWVPIATLTHTAAGYLVEAVPQGQIRAVDAGGTSVNVSIIRVNT